MEQEQARRAADSPQTEPHPVYDTIGGRSAAQERTAIGDQDARSERFPQYQEDPMLSRDPAARKSQAGAVSDVEQESPWNASMHRQVEERERIEQEQEQERTTGQE